MLSHAMQSESIIMLCVPIKQQFLLRKFLLLACSQEKNNSSILEQTPARPFSLYLMVALREAAPGPNGFGGIEFQRPVYLVE